MKKIIYLSLLLSQLFLNSQDKKFFVFDESSKKPVDYCNVLIVGKDKGEYSDKNGIVKIKANGTDSLIISHILYNTRKVKSGSIKDTIWLSQRNQFLEEVIVNSSKDLKEWSKQRKEKHQWYIQPKTEFCTLLEKQKGTESISKVRFPVEYITSLKNDQINEAVFRLNIYHNSNGNIGEKLNFDNLICELSNNSNFIFFDLGRSIVLPEEGLFLGIEFIGFQDSENAIIKNEKNNFIKLNFASTKKSKTYFSNKFINEGQWSILEKNNTVFPFELKYGLSLILVYK